MGAKLGSKGGPIADINVTPLIDVVLVLLVVFMVITPMLESGKSVDLPKATQTTLVSDSGQFIIVSVTHDNAWYIEQDEVTADNLLNKLNAEFRKRPTATVLVKGDRRLKYKDVRAVMDLIAEGGLTTVLVAATKE